MLVGLVSDTHGRFDAALERVFHGCDCIVHAGDVVGPAILRALARIAPVEAVRGNNDVGELGRGLPDELVVELGELRAFVVHELGKPERPRPCLREPLERVRPNIVVYGHSHRPGVALVRKVLYVNSGSAGPRRFRLPRCAGRMRVEGHTARVEIVDLDRPDLPVLLPPLEVSFAH